MSVTNLPQKKRLSSGSVQPTRRAEYKSVTATVTVQKFKDENVFRKELIFVNTSPATLYLSFGTLPSTTDYTVALVTNAIFVTDSTDRVNGVWAAASGGQVNITEEF